MNFFVETATTSALVYSGCVVQQYSRRGQQAGENQSETIVIAFSVSVINFKPYD